MPKKNDFKLDVVSVRLVKDAPIYSEHTFNNPADIAAVMGDCMCQFDREVVCVVNLRSDLKPINVHFASVGSLNEAMAHPRELFKSSILSNAASMMLIHCHPSGNVFPSKAGDKILALLEAVFGFWNNQISLVFAMLGQSPVSFKGGGPWAVIEGIEPVFVAVGSSLVVLFFVIGFCSESIDVKDEMRFESIFRMLIRLGLAEWFVANNVTIMKAFFTSIGNLVGLISAGTTTQFAIDSTQADIIKGLGFGESLVMLILTALLAIIIIICGFFIIYTVYFRFLKILIIVPLGAIACSTMAGNRMVSHTMATYCKYFLSCVFEAVTMALAIVVCNAFINAGLPVFTGSYADWAQTLIYLCEMTFTIAMTVGSVKGAQTLTSKAFGL